MNTIFSLVDKTTRAMQYTTTGGSLSTSPTTLQPPSSPQINRARLTVRLRQPVDHIGTPPSPKEETQPSGSVQLARRARVVNSSNSSSSSNSGGSSNNSDTTIVSSYKYSHIYLAKGTSTTPSKYSHLTLLKGTAKTPTKANASTLSTTPSRVTGTPGISPRRPSCTPYRAFDDDDDDAVPYSPGQPGPFRLVARLESGAFGETYAVREVDHRWGFKGSRARGKLMCMKIFNKDNIMAKLSLHQVVQELIAYKILANANPTKGWEFVMQIDAALQDSRRFYFVMELMRYDMMTIFMAPVCVRQENARRWIAQTAMGLSAIHKAGIIHRDIKPENLLVDYRDNIRITDFGSAYVNEHGSPIHAWGDYTSEIVGTWPYLAPEIVEIKKNAHLKAPRKKYGMAVDYWALGCVAFELESNTGQTLFETEEDQRRYTRYIRLIHSGRSYFAGAGLTPDAEAMISGLLRVHPQSRFGIADLYKQSYFHRFDGSSEFEDIEGRALTRERHNYDYTVEDEIFPPTVLSPKSDYIPPLKSERSIDNFGWINPSGRWGKRDLY
ncbi:kinase-like protein [Pluteus cervinus]|uniref:Kinase-like protein n=1 Tax=Pluteus cervinus TaxID=181527 RepID=A0ACD3BDG5_9AGAR|nr:kinase-like protein [Pluteus cervinus]